MIRQVLFALVTLAALAACDDEVIPPRTPQTTSVKQSTPAERRDAACKSKQLPPATAATPVDGAGDVVPEGTAARVEIEGAPDEAAARAAIGIAAGDAVTVQKTQAAIRKLWAMGAADDVRLEAHREGRGVVLHFKLSKRARFGQVVIHGGTLYDAPELEKALAATGGSPYDPVAIVATRSKLVDALHERGYADAAVNIVGTRAQDGTVDLCVDLHEGDKITIDTIGFKGLSKLKEADLRATIDTDHGRINAPGGILDQAKIDEAIAKMADIFDTAGLAKGRISTKTTRNGDKVSLLFDVEEGPVVRLRRYDVKGDLIADAGTYRRLLSLKAKDPFSRSKLVADIQKIADMHEKKGRKDLVVQPQTQLDDKNDTVDVVLVIVDPKKQKPPAPPPPPKK
ncbi:MAG TPA: POTRA domain-containing protein [Polyangiaceae bacterium]